MPDLSFRDVVEIAAFPVLFIEYFYFWGRFKSFHLFPFPHGHLILPSVTPFIFQ